MTLTARAAEGCSFFQGWDSTSRSSKGFPKRFSHPLPKGLCLGCESFCGTARPRLPGWRSHSELTGGNSGRVWDEELNPKTRQGMGGNFGTLLWVLWRRAEWDRRSRSSARQHRAMHRAHCSLPRRPIHLIATQEKRLWAARLLG